MKSLRRLAEEANMTIKEYASEILAEPLNEMAVTKQKYQIMLLDRANQIIENWCVCKYCTMFDKRNQNHKHWHRELAAHVMSINAYELKSGSKEKITQKVFINDMDCNITNNICGYAYNKWTDENFPMDKLPFVAEEFVKELSNLIAILSEVKTQQKAKDYCYSI